MISYKKIILIFIVLTMLGCFNESKNDKIQKVIPNLELNELNDSQLRLFFIEHFNLNIDTVCGYSPEFYISFDRDDMIPVKLYVQCIYYKGSLKEKNTIQNSFDFSMAVIGDSLLIDGEIYNFDSLHTYVISKIKGKDGKIVCFLEMNKWEHMNTLEYFLIKFNDLRKSNPNIYLNIEFRNAQFYKDYEKNKPSFHH